MPFGIQHGNSDGIALPSAVRNGGPFASNDIINEHGGTIICFLNVTAVPTIITINARIQLKDPASGVYIDAPGAVAGSARNFITVSTVNVGLFVFQLGNVSTDFISSNVSRIMRVLVTHSGAGDFTYSVGYSIIH
jgi:hypothetical protein